MNQNNIQEKECSTDIACEIINEVLDASQVITPEQASELTYQNMDKDKFKTLTNYHGIYDLIRETASQGYTYVTDRFYWHETNRNLYVLTDKYFRMYLQEIGYSVKIKDCLTRDGSNHKQYEFTISWEK